MARRWSCRPQYGRCATYSHAKETRESTLKLGDYAAAVRREWNSSELRQLLYQRFNGERACQGNANFVGHRHMERVATVRSRSTSMGAVPTSAFIVDRPLRGRVPPALTDSIKNKLQ